MLLQYLKKLKIQIFCRCSADMEVNATKLHFQCTNFTCNSCMHVTSMLSAFMCFLIKILSLSLNTMLIVDKHCSDICCDEFLLPQIDCKSKQVKEQWHEKLYLQSVWGKLTMLNTKIHLWINNNVRGNKNAICLHFIPYLLNICRHFEFLISQVSVATCLRWGGHCCIGFVANITHFPAIWKFWKSVKIWQSCSEFKGGNFFETVSI